MAEMIRKALLYFRSVLPAILLIITYSTVMFSQSIADTIIQIPDVVVRASVFQQFRSDIKTDEFTSEELSPLQENHWDVSLSVKQP